MRISRQKIWYLLFTLLFSLCIVLYPMNMAFATSAGDGQKETKIQFTADGKGNIPVLWNDGWFQQDNKVYNHELAKLSLALSASAYNQLDSQGTKDILLKNALCHALGFQDYESFHYDETGEQKGAHVGFALAQKNILQQNKQAVIVAVVIRGTHGAEWYDNFNLAQDGNYEAKYHSGFKAAADEVLQKLQNRLKRIQSSGVDATGVKILVTGHSRGGAVANIVAHMLNTSVGNEVQTYAYTFATPNVGKNAEESLAKDANIFNIINPDDFITTVPLEQWGYDKYGITMMLPCKDNHAQYGDLLKIMKEKFTILTGGGEYITFPQESKEQRSFAQEVAACASSAKGYYETVHTIKFNDRIIPISTFELFQYVGDFLAGDTTARSKAINLLWTNMKGSDYSSLIQYLSSNAPKLTYIHAPEAYASWLEVGNEELVFGEK